MFCSSRLVLGSIACLLPWSELTAQSSVARVWNELCLNGIRRDFPAPTVHARNLYHCSAAMYDAWAAYDETAVGLFHNERASSGDIETARHEAVSYAAYWILRSRYLNAVGGAQTISELTAQMNAFGYAVGSGSVEGTSPQAVGNRCAFSIIENQFNDGSNQLNDYQGLGDYGPVNRPLILQNPGTGILAFPNRWQPLAFDVAFTQNGLIATQVQTFIGSHWGQVKTFSLPEPIDPGPPPFLGAMGDDEFKKNNIEVISYSSLLDPQSSGEIDISPRSQGNNSLGTNDGEGYELNPFTQEPYQTNVVNLADYGRVIAEFWADGPSSETPPGHWNVIANQVSDDPRLTKQFRGQGRVLSDLEWDVKLSLALNGALHDAAIAAWWVKRRYDYVRPITSIRHLATLGQSSDPNGPRYHPQGIPLVEGLVEMVTSESSQAGSRHEGLLPDTVAIYAWRGEPDDPATEIGQVGWIDARRWLPYQRDTFVTPAFAGYVSGHSAFSRAAAEVLTAFTGNAFFPGGLGSQTINAGDLEFEYGPSTNIELQWATYYDAADQAGISRLYGGIHVAADDGPGREIGSKVGLSAFKKAEAYLTGSVLDQFACEVNPSIHGFEITWPCIPGYQYRVEAATSANPDDFVALSSSVSYQESTASFLDSTVNEKRRFYRVVRSAP